MTFPWLYSRFADSVFILAPAFVVTLLVELLPAHWLEHQKIDAWAWLLLVVGVDVAHVYSTLWRTYFDPAALRRYRGLLIGIPVACWLCGVVLYSMGALVFWRVLAYVAVWHFIRQQYGFLRLYSRREAKSAWRYLDGAAIYLATIYPLVYWHVHGRSFQWFVKDDFIAFVQGADVLERAVFYLYAAVLAAYAAKELRAPSWNIPKNLVMLGTALSWYCGIVRRDGDLAFTATNVVAHGVPYMALVWIHQRRQKPEDARHSAFLTRWFQPRLIPVNLGVLLAIAYLEEGIWDALVWRDHGMFYAWLAWIPRIEAKPLLSVIAPLLALPQATHYVLDGFIWKVRELPYTGGSLRSAGRF